MFLFLVTRLDVANHDEYGSMVVRAISAKQAKEIAIEHGEGYYTTISNLSARLLSVEGKAEVILATFHAG